MHIKLERRIYLITKIYINYKETYRAFLLFTSWAFQDVLLPSILILNHFNHKSIFVLS